MEYDNKSIIIRFAGKNKRINLSSDELIRFKNLSMLTGITFNSLIVYLAYNDFKFLSIVEENEERVNLNKDMLLYYCLNWEDWIPFSPKKQKIVDHSLKLKMRLNSIEKERDPIVNTIDLITSEFQISKSNLLKILLFDFLQKNNLLLNSEDNSIAREKNKRQIVWMPYYWPVNILDYEFMSEKYINNFSVLLPGTFKGSFDISLRFNKTINVELVMQEILPVLCFRLWRSPSSVFQMLYLCFLSKHKIVNKSGILNNNFGEKIKLLRKRNSDIESALN